MQTFSMSKVSNHQGMSQFWCHSHSIASITM